jgi:hypothetical protein
MVVKVSIRIHNMNTDRLKFDWVYKGDQLMFFSIWVSDPGVYNQKLEAKD